MEKLILFYVFFFGASFGSFANVCIYRLPRNLSIVRPRSRCTRCGFKVSWYDNIPILNFLWLGAKCRHCATPLHPRYAIIELISAFLAVYLYKRFGFSFTGLYLYFLTLALLVASAIDLEFRIIPDSISIGGTITGLLVALSLSWLGTDWFVSFKVALLGSAVGAGLLWSVGWFYEKLTGREGMGLGDVKLLALFGAHAGPTGVLASLFYGSFFGSIAGITLMIWKRRGSRHPIPFGPFLCLGLAIYVVAGNRWMDWFVR